MANGADPRHCVVPFVAVAVRVSVKPEPTGRPPMTPEIVLLWLTSIDPARAKPAGPLTAYATEESETPGASCRESPTLPTSLPAPIGGRPQPKVARVRPSRANALRIE